MEHYDDYLVHFGVKGMKWGVRKDDEHGMSRRRYKKALKKANKSYRSLRDSPYASVLDKAERKLNSDKEFKNHAKLATKNMKWIINFDDKHDDWDAAYKKYKKEYDIHADAANKHSFAARKRSEEIASQFQNDYNDITSKMISHYGKVGEAQAKKALAYYGDTSIVLPSGQIRKVSRDINISGDDNEYIYVWNY